MKEDEYFGVLETIKQIRDLHVYVENYNEVHCDGCNFGGWEGEAPEWPCQTARLVYSEEEITEILDAVELACVWSHQRWLCTAPDRQRRPRNSYEWWGGYDRFIADMVFPKVSVNRGEISYTFVKEP